MKPSPTETAAWYNAESLVERVASLREPHSSARDRVTDLARGRQRIERWRAQNPFQNDSVFARRLEMDSLTDDDLIHLLGEPAEAVRDRHPVPPGWVLEIDGAFSQPTAAGQPISPRPPDEDVAAGLLSVVQPLIDRSIERLRRRIREIPFAEEDRPFEPSSVSELMLGGLAPQLLPLISRTLVLELHVAGLQGRLQGETPEERFRSFIERARRPDMALTLLSEYPVMARQLTVACDQWVAASAEFLGHLRADWDAIRASFSPDVSPGRLVDLDCGAGDRHCQGRSVIVARFASGLKLVYKPRSMAVEEHFQELLSWLNDHGMDPRFRTIRILDREDHGWVEFVKAAGCASIDEIRRFYRRQGGYLALLYALEATDFHFENLIAAGEDPVLIDLESLFHPRFRGFDGGGTDLPAADAMMNSVLRVGLLPQRAFAADNYEGIDISGLGGTPGQLSPDRIPQWEDQGTDAMRLIRARVRMSGGNNRPSVAGAEVRTSDYGDEIAAGFETAYRLLFDHRDELLDRNGPIARFADDDVRVILRPTRTYALLLMESFHPDLLRDALDRERFFDRLWVGTERMPHAIRAIPSERKDLQVGDVPIFATHPCSRDLWDSAGNRIDSFFDQSGLDLVHRRFRQLDPSDLARQVWYIRASMATLAERSEGAGYALIEPSAFADGTRFLDAARAAGDRLDVLALKDSNCASWVGVGLAPGEKWALTPLGLDLYGGLPGVATFLAYLGRTTGQRKYTDLAEATLTAMLKLLQDRRPYITSLGGFDGWGGVIYALSHLGAVLERPDLWSQAEEIVALLPPLVDRAEDYDVISGIAGCILGLLALQRCVPSEGTIQAAIRCGDRLLAGAQRMENGIGWPSRIGTRGPLAGFSHGVAGIALALLELAEATGADRFRTAALEALSYERSLFSPAYGNWRDLRNTAVSAPGEEPPESFMIFWCHGAPGVGMGRLHSLHALDDPEVRAEIDTALRTTLAKGFGINHSLCHGDLGNLDLLLEASRTLADPEWDSQVKRIASMIVDSIDRDGWRTGLPSGIESPGLMVGLAGTGYEMLRLADPDHVPSILVLAPPER